MNFWTAQSPTQIDPFVTFTYDKAGNVIAAHAHSEPPHRRIRGRVNQKAEQARRDIEELFTPESTWN